MHTQYTNVRADREIIPFVVTKYLTPALSKSRNPSVAAHCLTNKLQPV